MIEYKEYVIMQSAYDNHIWISKKIKNLYSVEPICSINMNKKLNEKELEEYIKFFVDKILKEG